MAISNYSELQASIALWMNRTDLADLIPDFVKLAESALATDLRIRDMVKIDSLSGTGYVALPVDFLEFVYVKQNGVPIEWIAPDLLRSKYLESGEISFYTIEGDRMLFNPSSSTPATFSVAYYAKPAALTVSPSNVILTKYPSLYLFKSVAYGWQYVMDSAKAAQYETMYRQELAAVKSADGAAHISGSPLRIRTR